MALIAANELKRKLLIDVEGQPYAVIDVFFASPTARGVSTALAGWTKFGNRMLSSPRPLFFTVTRSVFTSWMRRVTSSSRFRPTR